MEHSSTVLMRRQERAWRLNEQLRRQPARGRRWKRADDREREHALVGGGAISCIV
jgi:hypothetical protein